MSTQPHLTNERLNHLFNSSFELLAVAIPKARQAVLHHDLYDTPSFNLSVWILDSLNQDKTKE